MKDMYSFHLNETDLQEYYDRCAAAYFKVFERCELKSYKVEASGGAFSDDHSHEFAVVTDAGEDTIIVYEDEDRAENLEVAKAYVGKKNPDEAEIEMGSVSMNYDGHVSVANNAEQHGVPEWKILKTVVYKVDDGFVGVVIRGDLSVSVERIKKELGAESVRVANDAEVEKLGLVPGFISPVNNERIPFVGDASVTTVKNWVTGANELNQDLVGVNLGRDFTVREIAHLAELDEETLCSVSGCKVRVYKAIEVGNIFKLGTKYTEPFGIKYTDADGAQQDVLMGCYGIGVSRLLGTIAEVHNDENGIIWPKEVTPYHVHLIDLGKGDDVKAAATNLYDKLCADGWDVLYDDRDERAGKKFNDADLIGIPLRVVVSERNLESGELEFKMRTAPEAEMIKADELSKRLADFYG